MILTGGTADITVHEKLDDSLLRELYKASGGACGGTAMDAKLLGVIEEIVGKEVFSEFQSQCVEGYMDLLREIEVFKRNIKPDSEGKINMAIPVSPLNDICSQRLQMSFKDVFSKSSLCNSISLTADKLRFKAEYAKSLFNSVTDQIVEYIKVILQQPEVEGVNRFLMVGGFSESPMVRHAINISFPEKRLIIPQDAGLAVVKGAVLFGHRPESIKSRIIKYSYGVQTTPMFNPSLHDFRRRRTIDGVDRCEKVFSAFIKAGDPVELNQVVEKKYQTNEPFQSKVPLDLFFTVSEDPKYIDEQHVRRLGQLNVVIPCPSEHSRKVKVVYVLGDTELRVRAVEMETGTACETTMSGFC